MSIFNIWDVGILTIMLAFFSITIATIASKSNTSNLLLDIHKLRNGEIVMALISFTIILLRILFIKDIALPLRIVFSIEHRGIIIGRCYTKLYAYWVSLTPIILTLSITSIIASFIGTYRVYIERKRSVG